MAPQNPDHDAAPQRAHAGARLDSAAAWGAARCVPHPGSGALYRVGPVLLLAASSDLAELEPLLDHARMVAANGGEGRQLVRGFALQLATTNTDPPSFLALSPHGNGLAVFVCGDASVTVDGETLDGADSLAWVERLFRWPVDSVSGRLAGSTGDPVTSGPFDLRAGSVPADAFTMLAGDPRVIPAVEAAAMPAMAPQDGSASADADVPDTGPMLQKRPAAPAPAEEPGTPTPAPSAQQAAPPPPAPPAPAVPDAWPADQPVPGGRPVPGRPVPGEPFQPRRFESVLLDDPDAEEDLDLGPLPIPGDHVHQELDPRVSLVSGVYCKNNHFNDPRVLFCALCGINMVQQTAVPVQSGRPPLGVVVLDDGSVYQLDGDYLLGRDAESSAVQQPELRAITIDDQSQLISRVHARLELRGWDVILVDNNSTNGTFFLEPGDQAWRQLPPGAEHRLMPRTRIRIGNRSLAYDTGHQG